MSNEITKKAQANIDKILSANAFDKATSPKDTLPKETSSECAVCQCTGGNGMVRMNTVFIPCPACTTII